MYCFHNASDWLAGKLFPLNLMACLDGFAFCKARFVKIALYPLGGRNVLETVLSWYDILWNYTNAFTVALLLIELGRWVMDLVYRCRFDLIQSWWHSMKYKGFQAVCYLSHLYFFQKSLEAPHIPMDVNIHKLWIHVLPWWFSGKGTRLQLRRRARRYGEWNGSLLWYSCLRSPMDSPWRCKRVIRDLATMQ